MDDALTFELWEFFPLYKSCVFSGTCYWYVQTHEPFGWPENHGGNQESGWFRRSSSRQLHRQNTGTKKIERFFWHACQSSEFDWFFWDKPTTSLKQHFEIRKMHVRFCQHLFTHHKCNDTYMARPCKGSRSMDACLPNYCPDLSHSEGINI